MQDRNSTSVLVLARALHKPWNEGTRVIGFNVARAASLCRSVRTVSLTHEEFRGQEDERLLVEHAYTRASYGVVGDYRGLGPLLARARAILDETCIGVAHIIGLPLALAPYLRRRNVRVVVHVTLANQLYQGRIERLRAEVGWRAFDRWVDLYAPSSGALVPPLLERGMPRSKIKVMPAAIDMAIFKPADRLEMRRSLGLGRDQYILTYVGTLSPRRFPIETIREGLRQAGAVLERPLRFFVFAPAATHGYNHAWSETVRQALRDIPNVAVDVAMQDLSEAEKAAWFQATDVLLVPFEGQVAVEPPLTLVEAMACGAVILGSPQSNQSQLVQSGSNGFVYQTPGEMAACLVNVFQDYETAQIEAMRSMGIRTAVEQHSLGALSETLLQAWDSIERPVAGGN